MKTPPTNPWDRLVAAARRAPAAPREVSAPSGFATRVSALAFAGEEPSFAAVFARYAPRALCACGFVMLVAVTLNLGSALKTFEGEATAINDPVAEWLDASS
jgi:hypothetical protein